MKWFFQPRPDHDGAGRDDDSSLPGLIYLPAAVLQRHGARVLDPGKAEAIAQPRNAADEPPPPPRPTVYRARTLLIPGDLLRNGDFIAAINVILERVGMKVVAPTEAADPDLDTDAAIARGDQQVLRELRELPRPAVLAPREGHPVPVVIDAWIALQTLRAAAGRGQKQPDTRFAEKLGEVGRRIPEISLEHLLTGSAITGSPISNGGGAISPGTSSGDGSGPSITDSYLFSGGDPRTPVALFLDPPERRSAEYCADHYGRRPVVAVLDTGVAPHPWLEGNPSDPGGPYSADAGGFVAVDPEIQDAIRKEGEHARARGDKPRQVIKDAWDAPDADNPLIGILNEAKGHGTFIAGIVRQVAPEARVLAVRIMHSDNVCNEGDAICGLRHLAKRIMLGGDDLAATVDAVVGLLQRVAARRGGDVRALEGDQGPSRPRRRGRRRSRKLRHEPGVLPRGVRAGNRRSRPGARAQRGGAQPERHQGELQQRRRLGRGVGSGGCRRQHLPGRRGRQSRP